MKCSDVLVKILEENGVKHIFGHPGEQILSFYDSLKHSKIKHILMRHEQSAAHAADAYARISGKFSVCVSTAGPGAMNLITGVATAYKDSVPMLVITGDNDTENRDDKYYFQSINIPEIFEKLTFKNFSPKNSEEAIANFIEAMDILNNNPQGPVHINLAKNILEEDVEKNIKSKKVHPDEVDLSEIIQKFRNSKKPLIIVGTGVYYSHAIPELEEFINKNKVPVVTSYPARGIISEDNEYNLGLVGIRGKAKANYAAKNSDFILALGTKLSERTQNLITDKINFDNIVHVNLDERVLKGKIKIKTDIKLFLNELNKMNNDKSYKNWLDELNELTNDFIVPGLEENEYLLKPQRAIYEIFKASGDSYVVGDAGSHSTWFALLKKNIKPANSIFSGSFAPMGYGLPAAIGASIQSNETIILITGDAGFQMTIQELATVKEYDLPIIICVLNNNQLGIIRQWQESYYSGKYEVDLMNPDFIGIANSYGIKAKKIKDSENLYKTVKEAMKNRKAVLLEIIVEEENIPL